MITANDGKVLFTDKELGCQCCGRQNFAPGFEEALKTLRELVNVSMPISSAGRCAPHNYAVGGHYRSLHLLEGGRGCGTCAVDVVCTDGAKRAKIIKHALDLNWSVGVASNFIHLDRRVQALGLEHRVFHYTR